MHVYRYKEQGGGAIDRTVRVGDLTCMGSHCTVLSHAKIRRSVIGRRCYVGQGAQISDSFIMSGVTIGAGSVSIVLMLLCLQWLPRPSHSNLLLISLHLSSYFSSLLALFVVVDAVLWFPATTKSCNG
jgi:NDP-sugar pyrophosphorylase family protein